MRRKLRAEEWEKIEERKRREKEREREVEEREREVARREKWVVEEMRWVRRGYPLATIFPTYHVQDEAADDDSGNSARRFSKSRGATPTVWMCVSLTSPAPRPPS
jgi:hypothetical protein